MVLGAGRATEHGRCLFLRMNLTTINFGIISRQPSAATATGYARFHMDEQAEILNIAFSI